MSRMILTQYALYGQLAISVGTTRERQSFNIKQLDRLTPANRILSVDYIILISH